MHRSLVVAALAGLALLAGPRVVRGQDAPKDAPKDGGPAPAREEAIPDAAPRAPLPAEPSAEVKKKVQHAVKAWFELEPKIPDKAKTALQIKGDRAGAQGALSKAIQDWDALIQPNRCLRAIAWWKARFDETQPSENRPTGIQKVDFVTRNDNGKDFTYPLVVSIPKTYRAKSAEVYPVIVTIIDKEMAADPNKNLSPIYGKLLDTHILVASVESNLKGPGDVLQSLFYVHFNYKIDRDRVTLDAVGKGTRFVERLSTGEVLCLQWNGVVFRNPVMTSPLAGNLDLHPCAVVEAAAPSGPAASAVTVIKSNCSKLDLIPEGPDAAQKVRDWIATLTTRRIADPKNPYTLWFNSSGGTPKWGYWFQVEQAYDNGAEAPVVRVGYSVVPGKNLVEINGKNLAAATVLLNDEVFDLDQQVYVRANGIVVARGKVDRNMGITTEAMGGFATTPLGARNYIVTAMLPFSLTGDAVTPKAERDAADEAIKEAERKRLKEEELARQAEAERLRAEEEAKNPKPGPPADANGGVPVPAAETKWLATLDEAKAAAGGKPVLVVFGAAPDAPLQKAVDAALGSDEARKRMAGSVGVRLGPAAEGDAGKPVRDALALVSGKADAQAPYLAVVEWVVPAAAPPEGNPADGKAPDPAPPVLRLKKGLDVAPLKEEEVAPRVMDLIESLAPLPAPAKEPEKPANVAWGTDYESVRKAAVEKDVRFVVFFDAAADAPGRKPLAEAVAKDPEATNLLSGFLCVRLDSQGDAGARNRELQASLDKSHTAPALYILAFGSNEKKETVQKHLAMFDPVNLPEVEFLPRLRKFLQDNQVAKAAPASDSPKGAGPGTEGERKDAPPPAEPPKSDPPKQDPPKEEPPKK